jgi:hypothetical protein
MASSNDVKKYLAYWFQLGKAVLSDSGRVRYQPKLVIQGDRFSPEFEDIWATILANKDERLYLEGTDQTFAELLSPAWEISDCARCDMPVPMPVIELLPHPCPCNDLPTWPNEEAPKPRLPINSNQRLQEMNERLQARSTGD